MKTFRLGLSIVATIVFGMMMSGVHSLQERYDPRHSHIE